MPESIFPSLDGSSPGDKVSGDDISGRPLPPMMPTAAEGGQGSHIPPYGQEPMVPMEPGAEPPGEPGVPTGPRRRTAQERIAQLTRKYHASEAERGTLQEEIE